MKAMTDIIASQYNSESYMKTQTEDAKARDNQKP